MKRIQILHFPETFGVAEVTMWRTEPRILIRQDGKPGWIYAEFRFDAETGQREPQPSFTQPLRAKTEKAAHAEYAKLARDREQARRAAVAALQPTSISLSDEAKAARERVLAKTKWREVVDAISAGDEVAASRLYRDLDAAMNEPATPDDRHTVVRFRKLLANRKKTHDWELVLVALWDRIKNMPRKEVDSVLSEHQCTVPTQAALSRFLQRLEKEEA